nr:TPA_asm: 22 kDa protein [Gentiana ophiovirus]
MNRVIISNRLLDREIEEIKSAMKIIKEFEPNLPGVIDKGLMGIWLLNNNRTDEFINRKKGYVIRNSEGNSSVFIEGIEIQIMSNFDDNYLSDDFVNLRLDGIRISHDSNLDLGEYAFVPEQSNKENYDILQMYDSKTRKYYNELKDNYNIIREIIIDDEEFYTPRSTVEDENNQEIELTGKTNEDKLKGD